MDFKPQEMSNVAWSFATVDEWDTQLFAAMAHVAEERLGTFDSQALASLAWAYASAHQSTGALFAALGRMAPRRLGDFTHQGIEMTSWALSRCGSLRDTCSLLDCANDLNTEEITN
eukprot:gnl/TRDRNA2_/TRDRNA2_169822_c10_seq1.p1 gnl/TRDRNA2_/TRDRNA2_169822_c10~~gnl/TRDRNA2_/TRDRNA2_169822_c10_seq1.p1  ORF type:complete len:116 (-),score=17.79 gnl/TRDRNA2_/TRDRNA2_169822_c10_seq1:69-416(-)